ncbi:hypothetical protein [Legionella impletisoli]|uniref:Uncharacterized protein n=1 Tax=Legionella impletisoli TaxID=343510 RepID=A0A917N8X6_9GAMM|nr:hypothetical protein [Legionella impletisoli]GGI78100.1 hypothetical protein GCM10007966_03500 [Legionella impletisoli]
MESERRLNLALRKRPNSQNAVSKPSFFVHQPTKVPSYVAREQKHAPFLPPLDDCKPSSQVELSLARVKPRRPPSEQKSFFSKVPNAKLPPIEEKKPSIINERSFTEVEILKQLLQYKKQTLAEILEIHRLLHEIYILTCNDVTLSHKEKNKLIDTALKDMSVNNVRIKEIREEIKKVQLELDELRAPSERALPSISYLVRK